MSPQPRARTRATRTLNSFHLESLEFRTLFSAHSIIHAAKHHHPRQPAPLPPAESPAPATTTDSAPLDITIPDPVLPPTDIQPPTAGAGNSATVVARNLFYNGSAYDLGSLLGGIGAGGHDSAIASDKTALTSNAVSSFANISTYQLGINGIMIDLAGTIGTISAADFVFRVGNDNTAPSTASAGDWTIAPAPTSVIVRPGAGVGGSNRIEIIWADHAIQNQWLQITVRADLNTGLASNDLFYFGNLPGDTGDAAVNAADETATRLNPANFLNPAAMSNPYDFNRDGRVDAGDQLIARGNAGATLAPISVPAPVIAYDWHQSNASGTLNVWAPDPTDFGPTWTVDASNPTLALYGIDGQPSFDAIRQSQTADCYVLAALGSMALAHPSQIKSLIAWDGAGWAVTWHNANTGSVLVVHTSNDFSQSLQQQTGEVWWEVFEKTYTAFRTWNGSTGTNTMNSIGWGYSNIVLSQLGESNQMVNTFGQSAAAIYTTLQTALAAQHPVDFQTASNAPTMIQSHVYIIVAVYTDTSGTAWVTTYNPWGFYDTRTEADLLQNGIGSINIGTV